MLQFLELRSSIKISGLENAYKIENRIQDLPLVAIPGCSAVRSSIRTSQIYWPVGDLQHGCGK